MAELESRHLLRIEHGGIRVYEITINQRPPYSNRTTPLIVQCAFEFPGQPVWCNFGDFRVEYQGGIFLLSAGEPWTAAVRTQEGMDRAVAEAITLEKNVGVTFRETHFGPNGSVTFSAKGFFGFDGIKRHESETIGTKERDYFYYWPPVDHNFRP